MGLGLALWTGLVIAGNAAVIRYLLAEPSSWDLASARAFLQGTAGPALAASFVFFLVWAAGRRLCLFLKVPPGGALSVLPGALGLGLFGTAVLVFGRNALVPGLWLSAGLILLLGAAGLPPLPSLKWERPPAWKGALAAALGFAGFHGLLNALAPPVGWDALAYHLAIPRLYLDAGEILELPWLLHSHWPHLMELVYAAPLALGQESCAALIHAAVCAALLLAVFRLGREEGGPAAGWTAAALLAAQPLFLELASEPHSDGALILFHLLACAALWRWSKEGGRGLLAAAGLCAGLAAACKLQGLALGGALFAWLLVDKRRRPGAIPFVLWAALPAGPWYLKSWLASGNPVWPFYSALLGGRWEPAFVAAGLERVNVWSFPRDASLLWRYGPQFLLIPAAGLAAFAGEGRRLTPLLRFLFLPAAPMILLTVRYHEAWRFMAPLMPALALACGFWCAEACRAPGMRRAIAVSFVLLGLSPLASLSQSNELFAVMGIHSRVMPGMSSREVYKTRQLPFYAFYEKAAGLVPSGSKVLLFREVRGYHLRADYQWGDPVIQSQIIYERTASPEALRQELARQGLDFVLVNENKVHDASYYTPRTLALMDETLKRHGRLVLRDGGFALFNLLPLKKS